MDHVGGDWADRLLGLHGVRADIAVVRTPDGHGRVELSTFRAPSAAPRAPRFAVNTPGIPRLTFAQYGNIYRYCYVRGPGDVVIGLVEELS